MPVKANAGILSVRRDRSIALFDRGRADAFSCTVLTASLDQDMPLQNMSVPSRKLGLDTSPSRRPFGRKSSDNVSSRTA